MQSYRKAYSWDTLSDRVVLRAKVVEDLFKFKVKFWDKILR